MLPCLYMYPLMFSHLDATYTLGRLQPVYWGYGGAGGAGLAYRELWRARESKGWATHLVGRAAEYVMVCAPEKSASRFGEDLIATWREDGERDPVFDPGRSI